jgi:hypothetical protein
MQTIKYGTIAFILCLTTGCGDDESSSSAATPASPKILTHIANYAEPAAGITTIADYGTSVTANEDGQIVAIGSSGKMLECNETPVTQDITNCAIGTKAVGLVEIYDQKHNTTFFLQPPATPHEMYFGQSISMTADGQWLAVGAPTESLANTNCKDIMTKDEFTTECTAVATSGNAGYHAGAVYLFKFDGDNTNKWVLNRVIKQENQNHTSFQGYKFGEEVAFSRDGTTLIIAPKQDYHEYDSTETQPTTVATAGTDAGSIYVYSFNPTDGTLAFKYYHQIDGNLHLGKRLHPRPNDVLLASNQQILLAKAAADRATGVSLLADISTDFTDSEFTSIADMVFRDNKLYVGVNNLKSDCQGLITTTEFPDGKSTISDCINQAGTHTDSGGVMVFNITSSNNTYTSTLSELILPDADISKASLEFGRGLVVSEDGMQLFIGMDDDKKCTKVILSMEDDCPTTSPDQANTGAIQQYHREADGWTKAAFIKPRFIDSTEASILGSHDSMYQYNQHLYFRSYMKDACKGREVEDSSTPCTVETGIKGMITEYKLM